MTYTPEQLKQKTDDEINEIAAVVCMGWHKELREFDLSNDYYDSQGRYVCSQYEWQPCSPTEAGKAQCWDLQFKYKIRLSWSSHLVYAEFMFGHEVRNENMQRAVCEAAILSAQGE